MIPQANLDPAFPVFRLLGSPPFPRSSSPLCITMAKPKIFAGEFGSKLTILSWIITSVGSESEFVRMLPKSPTCLSKLFGAPWFFCIYQIKVMYILKKIHHIVELYHIGISEWNYKVFTLKGLKWGPASLQLFPNSPFWWMWNPCKPFFSPYNLPWMVTVWNGCLCSTNKRPLTPLSLASTKSTKPEIGLLIGTRSWKHFRIKFIQFIVFQILII